MILDLLAVLKFDAFVEAEISPTHATLGTRPWLGHSSRFDGAITKLRQLSLLARGNEDSLLLKAELQ